MSEHLPECPLPHCDYGTPNAKCYGYEYCPHYCFCAELRACEQRVRKSLWQECYDAAMETTERNYVWYEKRGYAAALDVAREALTEALNGLPIKWTSDELFPAVLTIHRVFDSLKEKS